MRLVALAQRREEIRRQTALRQRARGDAVFHRVVTAGLQRMAGILPPLAGEREIDVFAGADAERVVLEEARRLFAQPLGAGEAHAGFIAQRERAPPARRQLGGDLVEVAEGARVVPQEHRRGG